MLFLARFRKGAVASFEATRLATGYKNRNGFEIHGEKGALRFNFEDMNYLEFYDNTGDPKIRGWTAHHVSPRAATTPTSAAWWPDAHILGLRARLREPGGRHHARAGAARSPVVPLPDFADAYETQRVLEAALLSARERAPIKIAEVK